MHLDIKDEQNRSSFSTDIEVEDRDATITGTIVFHPGNKSGSVSIKFTTKALSYEAKAKKEFLNDFNEIVSASYDHLLRLRQKYINLLDGTGQLNLLDAMEEAEKDTVLN